MAKAKQRSFAQNYLQSQVDDNYSRFVVATLVLGVIGFLFCCRNLYYQSLDLNGELKNYYLAIWVAMTLVSLAFRYFIPFSKQRHNTLYLDRCMFVYALFICLIAASIAALQSFTTPNFTAFSFAILGTVTAYRASAAKYVMIMVLSTVQFSLVYFLLFEHHFSILFLLPIASICVVSFLIASSLEESRKCMLQMSLDLIETNEQLRAESIQDPLTKLYNRRYLTDFLQREIKEYARSKESLCIAVCDLDHFKKINDTLGHITGDEALKNIAGVLKQSSRATDILIRFGGEEFVIVMPRTHISAANIVIDRMRINIRNHHFDNISWPLSASFGLTEIKADDTDTQLLDRADQLLYQAKDAGRNCIVSDTDSTQHTMQAQESLINLVKPS